MSLPVLDIVVIVLYMTGTVAFGASFYFRSRSSGDYTTGGGRIPGWVLGMSIFATFVSSISFLALPGKAYQSDWNSYVFSLSIPFAALVAVRFFVPLFRSLNSISAYAYLETRFGPWARVYASSCYLLTQFARCGSILFLLALPLNALLGWDIALTIIGTGLLVMIYSMMGGIQAVVWTDAIQGIVLIGGALACLLVLLFSLPEGPAQMFAIGAADQKFSLGSFDFNFTESTFWVILIYGFFINLQNFGIDQNYVQRYLTAKSSKDAVFSTWFGSLMYLPVSLLFFLIGTALYAYYQVFRDKLPAELHSLDMADRVFPFFIVDGLPPGVTGLLIAAIFAAGMSTVSTSLNSGATIVLTDFYKRFFRKDASEKASMTVLYIASGAIGVIGIGVALAMIKVKSALDAWWALSSIFSGGMLGLLLLGYFARTARNVHAKAGVVVGILVICWISLSPTYFTADGWVSFRSTLHTNLAIVVGTIAIFVVGFVASTLAGRKSGR
ncbi:MAG TPA: sodium:solute symporter [Cyclobacteriaceae bacterium]|nr:sodium:solute symporter [Cyclobacteriaceae bacterium]